MTKASLIISNYNSRKALEECIVSIRAFTDAPYELIVVDNGSSDGSDEYCRKLGVTMISLPWNHSLATAFNCGLRLSSGDNLLLLYPNIAATHFWLSDMLVGLSKEGIAISRPVSLFSDAVRKKQEEEIHAPILFKRELLYKIGYLSPFPASGKHLFDDYIERAQLAGYGWKTIGNEQ